MHSLVVLRSCALGRAATVWVALTILIGGCVAHVDAEDDTVTVKTPSRTASEGFDLVGLIWGFLSGVWWLLTGFASMLPQIAEAFFYVASGAGTVNFMAQSSEDTLHQVAKRLEEKHGAEGHAAANQIRSRMPESEPRESRCFGSSRKVDRSQSPVVA